MDFNPVPWFFQVAVKFKVEEEETNRGLQALDPGLLQKHPEVLEGRCPENVDRREVEEEEIKLRLAPDQVPVVKNLLVELTEEDTVRGHVGPPVEGAQLGEEEVGTKILIPQKITLVVTRDKM